MPSIVYRITTFLTALLRRVPKGTNLGLFHLFWALMSGRLLTSRGALFPALSDLGLEAEAVRRASTALTYGCFDIADLLADWKQAVEQESHFEAHSYEGVRPVPVDLVGFFRPRLCGCVTKHYTSQADKALPALVFGLVGATGSVGRSRFCLPRLFVPMPTGQVSEALLQQQTLTLATKTLSENEALVVDAGFCLADLLALSVASDLRGQAPRSVGFVMRAAKNFTARKNALPTYGGKGRPPEKGAYVRPLARTYKKKKIAATPAEGKARFQVGRHPVIAHFFDDLVQKEAGVGSASFRCVVYFDPRFEEPLILVTNLPKSVSARALWYLYHDRWPIEQLPLAAKQMLGAERAFVFGKDSRQRLPQLALLAGNLLSYVAASSAPIATGFWDRVARPTCGRLRRVLSRLHFSDLPLSEGQVCKKASYTAHLPKGVKAHRRSKAPQMPILARLAA